jgi:hypothetical protein
MDDPAALLMHRRSRVFMAGSVIAGLLLVGILVGVKHCETCGKKDERTDPDGD